MEISFTRSGHVNISSGSERKRTWFTPVESYKSRHGNSSEKGYPSVADSGKEPGGGGAHCPLILDPNYYFFEIPPLWIAELEGGDENNLVSVNSNGNTEVLKFESVTVNFYSTTKTLQVQSSQKDTISMSKSFRILSKTELNLKIL